MTSRSRQRRDSVVGFFQLQATFTSDNFEILRLKWIIKENSCETICNEDEVPTHTCLEDYSNFITDENLYFYPVLDRTTPTAMGSDDKNEKHIVWLDMEMTGLEVEQCHILELACLITDEQLKPVSDCLNIIIHQTDQVLENMSNWCKVQHKKTGLINDCRSSKVTLEEAQQKMLQHLRSHVPRGMCPLAGNSIYMDRIFLRKYMPLIDNYLHYRVIDVSTIKELARRWQPNIDKAVPKKRYCHRAAIDIKDSLNELYYYKNHLFVVKE